MGDGGWVWQSKGWRQAATPSHNTHIGADKVNNSEPTRPVAKFIRKLNGWSGDARLYQVDPPIEGAYDYVVASAVDVFGNPETYLFGADDQGEVASWGELTGSYRGDLNHEEALNGAGYEVQQ